MLVEAGLDRVNIQADWLGGMGGQWIQHATYGVGFTVYL